MSTIRDLPDVSRLEDDTKYLLSGHHLKAIVEMLQQHQRGDNVQTSINGGVLRKAECGDAGYALFAASAVSLGGGGASPHPLKVQDASKGDVLKISVTPGVVVDTMNAGTAWTPTLGGTRIDTKTGTPPAYPTLTVDPAATCAYLHGTITSATGFITALTIQTDTGAGVPPSTLTDWYLFLTALFPNPGSSASIDITNDGVLGSQQYRACGVLPLVDGGSFVSGAF